jgi:outer membrane protein OmpA-like peptidoglycan-associated protein
VSKKRLVPEEKPVISRAALLCMLMTLQAVCALAQKNDTVSVFFPFNESALTVDAKFIIDSAIYKGIISTNRPIQIVGYADAVGTDSFNLRLSRQRATSVKTWLAQSGFRKESITLVIGKGESSATAAEQPGGNLADRRVDIVTMRQKTTEVVAELKPKKIQVVIPRPAVTELRKASATDISTVPVGETILLDNIYFYAGRHVVRKESDEALNALVTALKEHPEIKIRIEGHVCCVPASFKDAIDDDTGLEELSLNRAAVIRDYLISHGIAAERLSYVGFGRKYPLIPFERSEEDANRNRRVEIRIVQ